MPKQQRRNARLPEISTGDQKTDEDISYLELFINEIGAVANYLGPEDPEFAERNVRARITQFRNAGLNQAAKHLQHYLQGDGRDLIIPAAQHRSHAAIAKAEEVLLERWVKALIGTKPYENEEMYLTFSKIALLRDQEETSGMTPPKDWFQANFSQSESSAISQDFGLAWGATHLRAAAVDGLSVTLDLATDVVSVVGLVSIGTVDSYDFDWGPGAYDGKVLEKEKLAKPYWMIAGWERIMSVKFKLTKEEASGWSPANTLPFETSRIVSVNWSRPNLDQYERLKTTYFDKQ